MASKQSKTPDKKILSRWNDASKVEEVVWNMKLSDFPRGENRAVLNRLYNGDPPFDEATAEINGVQINRNDLTGPNVMTQGRRQWIQAFLKPGNYFNVAFDSGPQHKRREYSHTATRHANNLLHGSAAYLEQSRASGGTMLLHGVGPSIWRNRRSVIPRPIPISSIMIPSETDIDWDNLEYFALFQEWTPAQLWKLVYGFQADPGWDTDLVQAQWEYVREQTQKQPNATAFQYMPERIEELYKQDMGWWGSDAVPTIDGWDCYFRGDQDEGGWYRRIILDWGVPALEMKQGSSPPTDKPGSGKFLYTSKNRIFANDLKEILHCQFGDCSAVFPQKYHSVRSMGWMLWGVCDLENRLHCKFSEALFEQMMWFFRTASNADMIRLKKADFFHMGVIPQGIDWVKANERYAPPTDLVTMGFARFQKLIADNASSFTQDFDNGKTAKEMTATETMARVNSVNALVSGLLTLAYNYEEFKDREIMRRLCIKGNPDPLAQKFRKLCFEDKLPSEMLDPDRMIITRERSLGAGNKTLEMAIVQFLQQIRPNLGPDAQRRVDHIGIETATDDAALAEELAPVEGQTHVSNSMLDAQLSTDRLMKGLPYLAPKDAVPEDYVKVWLTDLGLMISAIVSAGGMAKPEDIAGFQNMAKQIGAFLQIMGSSKEEIPKVKEYAKNLSDLMNHVKAFQQRLQQAAKAAAQNGQGNGVDAKTMGDIQSKIIIAKSKASLAAQSHAQKTAQRQVSFEASERQKERQANAELRRTGTEHYFDQLTTLSQDLTKSRGKGGDETKE